MKRIHSLLIIFFVTILSVITMMYYSEYAYNINQYKNDKFSKQLVDKYNKAKAPSESIAKDDQEKVLKDIDEKKSHTTDYLENDDLTKKKVREAQQSHDTINSDNSNANLSNEDIKNNNESKDILGDAYPNKTANSLEDYNYNIKEAEQSVFKVSTGKIEENLTTSDKIKLLYVSFKLGRENYKKVEEYLYAEDAEDGVLKALKLLKDDLSEKEYEKVRKIAGKFIDMDAAERLK